MQQSRAQENGDDPTQRFVNAASSGNLQNRAKRASSMQSSEGVSMRFQYSLF